MDNAPRHILRQLIARYGHSLLNESPRLEGLMREAVGEHRPELFVLLTALREQVPADLLKSEDGLPSGVLVVQLTKRLQNNCAFTDEAASWAVESWALALGVISEAELNAHQSAPRDAATRQTSTVGAAIDAGKKAYQEEKRKTELSGRIEAAPKYTETELRSPVNDSGSSVQGLRSSSSRFKRVLPVQRSPFITAPALRSLKGTGDLTTEEFSLERALYIFEMTSHGGEYSTFNVTLCNSGEIVESLYGVLNDPKGGVTAVGIERKGQYYLEISADESWQVEFRLPQASQGEELPLTFTGKGKQVTPFIQFTEGKVFFKCSHRGEYNFAVIVFSSCGEQISLVVNSAGSVEAADHVEIPRTGLYLLDVSADGDWKISVEDMPPTRDAAPSTELDAVAADVNEALVNLGYQRPAVERAISLALREGGDLSVESILRRSLRNLAKP